MKIGKELTSIVEKKGVCQEWFDQMKTLDNKDWLFEIYVRGIDFCLSNDFPTSDYIREDFVGRMEEYGVHLDESLNTASDRCVATLDHRIGRVKINDFGVPEIFVKHESDLIITAEGNSFVVIDMFDDSELHVIVSADSKVYVNHYGSTLKAESSEGTIIKVIEEHKKTH